MYLQSVHLTRLLSRLMTVKSLQSEWLNTELFSAECGSTLNSSRVASANLVLYPTIIPAMASMALQTTINSKYIPVAVSASDPIGTRGPQNLDLAMHSTLILSLQCERLLDD